MQIPDNIGLHKLIRLVYQETDRYMEDLKNRAANQDKPIYVSCKAGCAACCTYIVTADMSEAIVIASEIQRHTDRDRILGRLITWVAEWGKHSNDDIVGAPSPHLIEWQSQHKACPFLDRNAHLCLVYESRPVSCRVYHACEPRPGDANPCLQCKPPKPPQDCFTTKQHVKHGHAPWVYQMDNDLVNQFQLFLGKSIGQIALGVMPVLVWYQGQRLYNWKANQIKRRPLYIMQESCK